MNKMTNTSRLILALVALAMLGSYLFPLWRIDLWAPQYPEGLSLYIWHNKLGGDVEIINGLNHYIGMAHLKQASFPEFGILPYLIVGFVVLGLLVAFWGQKRLLLVYLGLMLGAGVVALWDFYHWGYQYGHNLDPNAAIKVPGMSYQPPVVGYKELLNFGAYSIPDKGGWIFVGAGVIVAILTIYELLVLKGKKVSNIPVLSFLAFILAVFTQGCSVRPEPINYGQDACTHCKMTIVDNRFGCELVTDKGKTYKFDDLQCMVSYIKSKDLEESTFSHLLVNDYENPAHFINVKESFFIKSELFKSPMRGDIAAFKAEKELSSLPNDGQPLTWMDLKNGD